MENDNKRTELNDTDKKLHVSGASDSMKYIISFFEKLGFSFQLHDINKEYFYMNKWLNDFIQIDAQGNENHIEIRLIGEDVKEYERYDTFNEDKIFQKISNWESYYH